MTEAQNTAVVQDMYAAFGRGDIAALVNSCTEDVQWIGVYGTGPQVPTSGERRGKAAVTEFFGQVGEHVKFSSMNPQNYIATGNIVVVLGNYAGTSSIGKPFASDFAMVFHLQNGKVVRFQEFCDSLGLTEAFTATTRTASA